MRVEDSSRRHQGSSPTQHHAWPRCKKPAADQASQQNQGSKEVCQVPGCNVDSKPVSLFLVLLLSLVLCVYGGALFFPQPAHGQESGSFPPVWSAAQSSTHIFMMALGANPAAHKQHPYHLLWQDCACGMCRAALGGRQCFCIPCCDCQKGGREEGVPCPFRPAGSSSPPLCLVVPSV